MEFLKNPNFDFLGKTRYFVGASLVVVLAGLAYMLSTNTYLGRSPKGYGVEFSGGSGRPGLHRIDPSNGLAIALAQ